MPMEMVMPPPSAAALVPTQIARQPIYDANVKLAAYELIVNDQDPEAAASTVAQIGMNIVIDAPAWIPLTHGFLYEGHAAMLPSERIVFEVDPAMATDPAALAALRDLRNQGFTLAIDPFEARIDVTGLLNMVQAVKIDATLDRATLADHVVIGRTAGVTRVAKNVETHEQFQTCKMLGFDLFQGYFFAQPRHVENRPMAVGSLNKLRLIGELQDPKADIDQLGAIVQRDVGLSYNLLRFVNSAFFSVPRRIESIHDALVMLGLENVKRWATLMALADAKDKPHELIVTGLVRARMAELVAVASGERRSKETYFMIGMLSIIDALLDTSLVEVLRELPLSEEIMGALLRYEGTKGELLHGILAYERGDFHPLLALMPAGVPPADFYVQAIEWATDASGGLVGVPAAA
jgi:EAL and modified HD-GYP domain-containing signal transduction protein